MIAWRSSLFAALVLCAFAIAHGETARRGQEAKTSAVRAPQTKPNTKNPSKPAVANLTVPSVAGVNIADIVDQVDQSVVNVQATSGDGGASIGSGFCLSAKGEIVTNFHVIAEAFKNAGPITVVTPDGRTLTASVRGHDEATDLALLEVDFGDKPITPLPLGNSDVLRVGDWVFAIGSPFELDHTVTLGIISGKGRTGLGGEYDDFLQTDAAINLGNSGGPLMNLKGEVIGINTLVVARAQGLGFAIPANLVKDLLPQLREAGYVRRGSLGIEAIDLSTLQRRTIGLENQKRGILVVKVERGLPGDQAGIRREDIILAVNDAPITSSSQFNRLIARSGPGSSLAIRIWRDEREYVVTAKPIEKK